MLGRVVVGLWLAILAATPVAAQDYERGMAAYRNGQYLTALRNWRPLAEKGHAAAQSSIGFLYNYGHGVELNYAEALKWYRRAAEQGFAPAQYHLGFLYTKGLGVAQDYVKAHMWFSLGAEGGLSYSDKNRAIVARRMTPAQIAKAHAMAEEWRAKIDAGKAKTRPAGNSAAKKAAARRAAARRAAAKRKAEEKAKARRIAAERAAKARAAEVSPKPAASAAKTETAAVPSPRPVSNAANAGKAADPAPLQKASASLPAAQPAGAPAAAPRAEAVAEAAEPVEVARRAGAGERTSSTRGPKTTDAKSGSDPVLLQLGASKSKALAEKAADRISKRYAKLLGDVEVRAVRKDLGTRGVYYRLRAGPIADGRAGRELCSKLAARGQSCLVLKP